jgi:hypothetical protein
MAEFSTIHATYETVGGMATPSDPERASAAHDASLSLPTSESDLLSEIQSAEADFERGDYIDLTPEQLVRCIETGEFPWPEESPA